MSRYGYKFVNDSQPSQINYSSGKNYPSVIDSSLSTKTEPNVVYEDYVHYVCINSSDRNVTSHPHVNQYKIDFEDTFKNISSIEIVNCTVANKGSVLDNPYLVLRMDGLNHLNFSSNNINKGFALIYLKNTTGSHVQPELGVLQRNVNVFRTPIATLNSISLSLVKPNGELFSFTESAGDVSAEFQNSFLFKIVCKEISRQQLSHRNVF
jgi:hypothetical protein